MLIAVYFAKALGCVFVVYWIIGIILFLGNGLFNMNRSDAVTVYPKSKRFDRFVWLYCRPLQILRKIVPAPLKRFCPPTEIYEVD